MNASWTDFAWSMLSQTADYILSEYGINSYVDFLQEVDKVVLSLQRYPQLGIEEPLLSGRPLCYRSVLVGERNKIVYVIEEEQDRLVIMDFWDTKREPKTLAESV